MVVCEASDSKLRVVLEPRPEVNSKFHEKFVVLQALGADVLAHRADQDRSRRAGYLAVRLLDLKHETENGERVPVSIELDRHEVALIGEACRELERDTPEAIEFAGRSGDLVNCAFKAVEASEAVKIFKELQENGHLPEPVSDQQIHPAVTSSTGLNESIISPPTTQRRKVGF